MEKEMVTYESILARLQDPERPNRFTEEKEALISIMSMGGFLLSKTDREVLLKVYDAYLSSKGY